MITNERMIELANAPSALHTIRHIEKETDYKVICAQKAKINGEWVDGICYYSVTGGDYYWRAVDNFNGFIEVKNNDA